jgi:hypothetical protein
MSEYILTHKHQTHNHAASDWRIHCGVEVTELSTDKQHTLSSDKVPRKEVPLIAFLCHFLDDHGVKPEKVLKKAGLADSDWDNPDSVHALYAASTKYWPRTLRRDSNADSEADAYASSVASDSDDSV